MRHVTSLIVFAFATYAAIASMADTTLPRKPHDLSGIWAAHGVEVVPGDDDDERHYASVVTIMKSKEGYLCQWSQGPGANVIGLASHDGDTFSASWVGKGAPGISIYKVAKDGKTMTGRWLSFPGIRWQQETLTFVAPLPKAKE